MQDSSYLIIDRKPQKFNEMKTAGRAAVFMDAGGKVLDYGVIPFDDSVYAVLYCDEVRNITLVTDKNGKRSVKTILWQTEEEYRRGTETLKRICDKHFSRQNLKINRYAEAIAEKLDTGVRLRVTDAADISDMVRCPECGIMNPAGCGYCLECGADI